MPNLQAIEAISDLPKPGQKRPESQALPQRGGIRPQTGRTDGMTKHLFKTSPSEGSTKKNIMIYIA